MTHCDVLVAGGGSAGLAAAVAAARAGASTLLIERGGMLGGMASQALVHTICGLYQIRDEPGARFANEGFPPEFAARLISLGGASPPVRMGRLDVLPHDPVRLAALGDGVRRRDARSSRYGSTRNCARRAALPRGVEEIDIVCRGQRESVSARAFIDTTGDASLTALAGAAFAQVEPARLQRPAYVSILRGTEPGWLDDDGRLRIAHRIAAAVKTGELPSSALGAGFRPGVSPDETFLTIDLAGDHQDGDPWNPSSPRLLAAMEMEGRRAAFAIAAFIREGCRVAILPCRAGVRESRRACGVHEMSEAEFLGGARPPDGIADAAWPMELRERPSGPRWRYAEAAAGIPLRCLRHRDVANLWVAGRCLSASHEAQSSLRVIGTCLATGEAAGLAAVETLRSAESCWDILANRVIRTRQSLRRTC